MAAETSTSICNIALARIGAKEITSLENDQSREASLCRRLFHPARRTVLAAHHWNGALRTAQLTADSDIISATVSQWDYGYPVPDDFIRLVSVHPSNDRNTTCEYFLQNANHADADLVILADSNQLFINYIFDNIDIPTMSQGFRDVLNFVLSRDLCMALGKSASKFDLSAREYRRALTVAKSIDGMEDYPSRLAEGSWVRSRYGMNTDQTNFND